MQNVLLLPTLASLDWPDVATAPTREAPGAEPRMGMIL